MLLPCSKPGMSAVEMMMSTSLACSAKSFCSQGAQCHRQQLPSEAYLQVHGSNAWGQWKQEACNTSTYHLGRDKFR